MVPNKKIKIILLSLPILVLVHGIEEYIVGLRIAVSESMVTGVSLLPVFSNLSKFQSIYIVYIIMQVILFTVIAALLTDLKKLRIFVLLIIGLLPIYQTHHIIEAVINLKYNPGLYTSFLFFFIGIVYIKEMVILSKKKPN